MDMDRTCKDVNEYGCMNYPLMCEGCIHSKNITVLSLRHDDNFISKRAYDYAIKHRQREEK